MERTRWETTYQGFRRDLLLDLAEMPQASPSTHYSLGPGPKPMDPELVSPRDDEAKIALLLVAVDRVLDRYEETMQHTGRTLLCWLRSTKPQTCYPKPFTLVGLKSSQRKNRQLWKRFFAFVFRASRMSVDARRHLTGIRFKRGQLRQIRAIWDHQAWTNVDLAQGRWPASRDGGENSGARPENNDEDDDEIGEEDENEADEGEGEEEEEEEIESSLEGGWEDDDDDDGEGDIGHRSEDEYQEDDLPHNADLGIPRRSRLW